MDSFLIFLASLIFMICYCLMLFSYEWSGTYYIVLMIKAPVLGSKWHRQILRKGVNIERHN